MDSDYPQLYNGPICPNCKRTVVWWEFGIMGIIEMNKEYSLLCPFCNGSFTFKKSSADDFVTWC